MFPELPPRLQVNARTVELYGVSCGILMGCLAQMTPAEREDALLGLRAAAEAVGRIRRGA